ncbi:MULTISPECIES: hypothetical protein [unclassified Streptomyces]|uniref:hypothetical protein n=1 Tax=unclassified Streptomyces TaxID=2593676 RepID=UPI002E330FF1|nr:MULTISPECIES: hypothetical protein [unclassified Streptomyces]WUC67809.1 hypothetical protein OG861_28265 [Streptomyces sp. NBC_00539]
MRRRRHSFQALTATGFLALALTRALVAPTAAQAHGDTVKVVITGQRDGHLTTEVTWENDGDAVDEAVAATVNATSADGSRTAGPWRLVRDAGGGGGAGWSTAEVLPPGAWKVSVDVGFPALGHAEKEIAVPVVDPQPSAAAPSPAGPAPSSAGPAPSSPGPAPSSAGSAPAAPVAAGAAEASGDGSGWWWTTAGVAVTALAGTAVGLWLRRARRR